jgi:intergrase/recombinase
MRDELSLLGVAENYHGASDYNNLKPKLVLAVDRGKVGAFGGIWTRDHYLTKIRTQQSNGAFDWEAFKRFIYGKYAKSTAPKVMSYAKRYYPLMQSGDLGAVNAIPQSVRSDVIKSMIILAKYTGCYEEFKAALKAYGIKLSKPSVLDAFVRIYSNNNAELGDWLRQVQPIFTESQKLLLRYAALTGLRKQEAINSFNLIIKLAEENKLHTYLNSNGVLEHFRFKALFLRGTKNVYISIVPEDLIVKVTRSSPVSYTALVKRLARRNIPCRVNQLRDNFGTFLIKRGVIREEIDLLQGRVSASIFTRHYFSPAIAELQNRVRKGLVEMEAELP